MRLLQASVTLIQWSQSLAPSQAAPYTEHLGRQCRSQWQIPPCEPCPAPRRARRWAALRCTRAAATPSTALRAWETCALRPLAACLRTRCALSGQSQSLKLDTWPVMSFSVLAPRGRCVFPVLCIIRQLDRHFAKPLRAGASRAADCLCMGRSACCGLSGAQHSAEPGTCRPVKRTPCKHRIRASWERSWDQQRRLPLGWARPSARPTLQMQLCALLHLAPMAVFPGSGPSCPSIVNACKLGAVATAWLGQGVGTPHPAHPTLAPLLLWPRIKSLPALRHTLGLCLERTGHAPSSSLDQMAFVEGLLFHIGLWEVTLSTI